MILAHIDQSIGFQEFDQEIDGYSDWMDRMNVPFIMGIPNISNQDINVAVVIPISEAGMLAEKTLDIESIPNIQHSALSFISDFPGLNT